MIRCLCEAGIVAGRLLLQFLGLGIERKGGLRLVKSREYHKENGLTHEVKITDVGGRFVDLGSLDSTMSQVLANFHNGASKASAHFTWDSGHQLDLNNLKQSIPIIRALVLTHLPQRANGPIPEVRPAEPGMKMDVNNYPSGEKLAGYWRTTLRKPSGLMSRKRGQASCLALF